MVVLGWGGHTIQEVGSEMMMVFLYMGCCNGASLYSRFYSIHNVNMCIITIAQGHDNVNMRIITIAQGHVLSDDDCCDTPHFTYKCVQLIHVQVFSILMLHFSSVKLC